MGSMSSDRLHSSRQIVRIDTAGPEETQALGCRLGALLQPGDVVLLEGELGAGKTCLTQGIARGLGFNGQVISPTFVLVGEYRGRAHLYHADLYRLEDPDEVAALELANATEDGVLVVEWPERDAGSLPAEHLHIRLEHRGPDTRALTLEPHGARARAILNEFSAVPSQADQPSACSPKRDDGQVLKADD
jgi:tRNA threonylcarbamoyladenosine biosynthesis protein TsaE